MIDDDEIKLAVKGQGAILRSDLEYTSVQADAGATMLRLSFRKIALASRIFS